MKKLIFTLMAFCMVLSLQAQKIKGDASCLKGQKEINIQFIYKGVTYDGDSEAKYLKEEDKAKDPEWRAAWTSSFRTEKWEPRLVEDLNKEIAKSDMECGEFTDADYTIIVKFVDIDPGSFAGPMSVPARITCSVSFVKTGSTAPFATMELKNVAYKYFMSPLPEMRVAEAMSCVGEAIGKQMSKIK
ncbi:MAG: hypothetical protein J6Z44_07075 [Bacteroidales bacterium]|jgi:hypothetical protein|nr:hypothetical protein [Bacteroidales bacterium]